MKMTRKKIDGIAVIDYWRFGNWASDPWEVAFREVCDWH
jgi:hypothetical protein